MLPGQVEVGQRAGDVEVAVGVEPLHERVGLVTQVALDLELRLDDRVADVVGELEPPPELVGQRRAGEIGHVADHAGHAHAGVGLAAGAVVVAALPVGVAHDGLAGDRVPRQTLGVEGVGGGDDHYGVDLARILDRPFEGLHPAQRTARDHRETLDSELVQEGAFGADHIRHGDHREVGAIGASGGGINGGRACRAAAAAK